MESYKTVKALGQDEFIERKSRFIGTIKPVTTEEEAQAFIEEKKKEYWNATHNCWAYVLRENMAQRYSDDGEPQGTAGIPILEILRKEEIHNAVIVVTRYYGGIQLGAGGLVRAYSQGGKIALDAGGRITMAACVLLKVTLPYPLYDRFLAQTEGYPMEIIDTDFTHNVSLELQLQKDYEGRLKEFLTELSSGEITPEKMGESFAPLSL